MRPQRSGATIPLDTPRLRARLAAAAEKLIAALDALDAPDEDLEDGHDAEYDEAELSGIGDADGLAEQMVGEPSLGATLDTDQRLAWGDDRLSDPVDGEATGTEDDLTARKSVEAWQADRAAANGARDQVQAIVRRKRGPFAVLGTVR